MLGLEARSSARAEHALKAKPSCQPFEIFSVVFSIAYNGIYLFVYQWTFEFVNTVQCKVHSGGQSSACISEHQTCDARPANILIYNYSAD